MITTTDPATTAGERLDRAGIVASTLCAIHCMGAALIAAAAPALRFIESPALEWGFVLTALAIAAIALHRGRLRHGSWTPLGLFAVGGAVLLVTRLVEWPSETLETAASITGAAVLVTGHVINIRKLRACACCAVPAAAGEAAA